jgi:hypothetical protein
VERLPAQFPPGALGKARTHGEWPVLGSSGTTPSRPSALRASMVTLPMVPAPPVTRIDTPPYLAIRPYFRMHQIATIPSFQPIFFPCV